MPAFEDKYTIRLHPKGGFIWDPPETSQELRTALSRKYPDIPGHRAKMQQALLEFESREESSRSQAQSWATEHAISAHDSSSQQNPSDPSSDRKKQRGRRKGPLSEQGRKHFQESYGKACERHQKSRTKCDPNTCENRLRKEVWSDNMNLSSASASLGSLPEPHRHANINTPRTYYAPTYSFEPGTWSMDSMSLDTVQQMPILNTVNNPGAAGTGESYLPPPPGQMPMRSGSSTVSSPYGPFLMESRNYPPIQTAVNPMQSYDYPLSQMGYGGSEPPMMQYTSPGSAYNHNHTATALGQMPLAYAYTYAPMGAPQPLFTNPAMAAALGDSGHYLTALTGFGHGNSQDNFQNNTQSNFGEKLGSEYDNNLDNHSRSVAEKPSKPSKGSLRARVRFIFKVVLLGISSSKHKLQIKGKPLALASS